MIIYVWSEEGSGSSRRGSCHVVTEGVKFLKYCTLYFIIKTGNIVKLLKKSEHTFECMPTDF